MIKIEELLKKHNLPPDSLDTTTIQAEDLEAIFDDHKSHIPDLERVGDFVAGQLRRISQVHSLRYRVKDHEHLLAKIVRKRLEQPNRVITVENYTAEITDLVGVRVLHLFKEDWGFIHDYISSTWDLKEVPTANIRAGDSEKWHKAFEEKGCTIKLHKSGYRSVHYLVVSQPTKSIYTTEVQVRTIFEEAWSEVDHDIRYPNDQDNPILAPLLFIFNRLAGNADEIASYIQELKTSMASKEEEHRQVLLDRDQKVADLQAKIEKLEIDVDAKRELKEELDTINNYEPTPAAQPTSSEFRHYLSLMTGDPSYPETLAKYLRRDSLTDMVAKMGSASLFTDATAKYIRKDPLANALAGHRDLFSSPLTRHRELFSDPLAKYRDGLVGPLAKSRNLYIAPRIVSNTRRDIVAEATAEVRIASGDAQGVMVQPSKTNADQSENKDTPDANSEGRPASEVDSFDNSSGDSMRSGEATQATPNSAETSENAGASTAPVIDDGDR